MNAWLPQSGDLWQLAGWTMIHYFWLGAAVAIAGGTLRLALRWTWPNVRYATSFLTLLALAAAPAAIAARLAAHAPTSTALQSRHLPGGESPSLPPSRQRPTTLGQSPELQDAPPVTIELAHAEPLAPQNLPFPAGVGAASSETDVAETPPLNTNPSPSPSLHGREMLDAIAVFLPWLWIVGAPLTFCLLAAGLVGSARLRRHGTPITSGPAFDACGRIRSALRITRRVSLAVCDSIAQPVLIGIVRPLILLPASALSGWTAAELEMVLLHELTHVRRWDNLVNLLQRVVESLFFFHPAVWLVSRQVRRDREECCDAAVVSRTQRPREYAELLVSIASTLPRGRAPRLAGGPLATASAMASHPLAGRIRRILKPQEEPMGITRRTLAAMIALPLVATAITVYTAAAQEEQTSPPLKGGNRGGITTPAESAPPMEPPTPASQPGPTAEQPPEQQFTFTLATKLSDIEKLAEQLRAIGKDVDIVRRDADGIVTLISRDTSSPTAMNASMAKFPALEDQKLADRAYKLLGLELERINEEELDRVKRLGYAGGLRVAANDDPNESGYFAMEGDILVGLHVWPVTDLKSLDAVLTRDDLGELNPLKYYVVRNRQAGAFGGGFGGAPQAGEDRVITGRLTIDDAALWSRDPAGTNPKPSQLEAKPPYSAPPLMPYPPSALPPTSLTPAMPAPTGPYQELGSAPTRNQASTVGPIPAKPMPAESSWNPQAAPQPAMPSTTARGVESVMGDWAEQYRAARDRADKSGKLVLIYLRQEGNEKSQQFEQNVLNNPEKRVEIEKHCEILSIEIDNARQFAAAFHIERAPAAMLMSSDRIAMASWDPDGKFVSNLERLCEGLITGQLPYALPAPAYLYDGKTFDQWRDSWRQELNPERRLESIKALAAFARAGYGKEAAAAILDVAAEYDYSVKDGDQPEGKLKEALVDVLASTWSPSAAQVAPADWLPALMERLAAENAKWRPLADEVFLRLNVRPQDDPGRVAQLLQDVASEPKYGPNASALVALFQLQGDEAAVQHLVRKALADDDTENALRLLRHLGFMRLDVVPEQLDLLFHQDADVRRKARSILSWVGSSIASNPDIESPAHELLLAILDDPQQAAKHADAVRALSAMFMRYLSDPTKATSYRQSRNQVARRLKDVLAMGDESLLAPALAGDSLFEGVELEARNLDRLVPEKTPPERREAIKQAAERVKAETAQIIDQTYLQQTYGHNPNVKPGTGSGFF